MHIWRKLATAEWLEHREQELELQFGEQLAIIHRPPRKRIEVEIFCRSASEGNRIRAEFGGTIIPLPRGWRSGLQRSRRRAPIRIGKRMLVVDSEEARCRVGLQGSNERVLLIPAGAAFGTGEHATTAMSLRILEEIARRMPPGWRLLDVGAGTGIIALAGRCFGAEKVVGIDNYPLGVATAKQNAALNRIFDVRFLVRDVLRWQNNERFDVITANLFSTLLIVALPKFKSWLKANGVLILSGILHSQEREILRALGTNQFLINEIRKRGKWIAIEAAVYDCRTLRRSQRGVTAVKSVDATNGS